MSHRKPGRVMTVEEIQALKATKDGIAAQMKGAEAVFVDVPVEVKTVRDDWKDEVPPAKAYPIETPPLGPGANVVNTTKTLLSEVPTEEEQKTVSAILEKAGINPVEELVRMYEEKVDDPEDPNFGKFVMSPGERRALMKEMLKYTHPQLKSVEHTGNGADNKLVVVLQMPNGEERAQEVEKRGKVIDVN